MKKGLCFVLVMLLAVWIAVSTSIPASVLASAKEAPPRVVDSANLLSEEDEKTLSETLNEISERQKADIIVVTVNSLNGATVTEYADDFYDYNGYGLGDNRDGILFLISMEEREWHISTRGYGITAFTDAGQEYISEQMLSDLSDGAYFTAFRTFAELCDDFLTQAATGEPYDIDNLPKGEFPFITMLLFDLAIGFVIALVVTGIMRLQLRSVGKATTADTYVKKGSLQLTKETDLFLYQQVERHEKPKEEEKKKTETKKVGGSTTHQSSSGATHGGSSGKF